MNRIAFNAWKQSLQLTKRKQRNNSKEKKTFFENRIIRVWHCNADFDQNFNSNTAFPIHKLEEREILEN